jgi:lysophospholipase L1-like esterase
MPGPTRRRKWPKAFGPSVSACAPSRPSRGSSCTANDPLRAKIAEVNRLLPELGKVPGITLLDIGGQFLQSNGELPRNLMADFCHPTEQGYAIWAAALKPNVQTQP